MLVARTLHRRRTLVREPATDGMLEAVPPRPPVLLLDDAILILLQRRRGKDLRGRPRGHLRAVPPERVVVIVRHARLLPVEGLAGGWIVAHKHQFGRGERGRDLFAFAAAAAASGGRVVESGGDELRRPSYPLAVRGFDHERETQRGIPPRDHCLFRHGGDVVFFVVAGRRDGILPEPTSSQPRIVVMVVGRHDIYRQRLSYTLTETLCDLSIPSSSGWFDCPVTEQYMNRREFVTDNNYRTIEYRPINEYSVWDIILCVLSAWRC
mmetsp:Transcript_31189/g.75425  ORF Transcript_31189/g.75425 Transcript_31189/m.75425 type:complete len:266 (+) Transcript_31189:82-879(+)